MPTPPPTEVVRLVFEARAAGDVRREMSLMAPDVSFARHASESTRIEVDAHRIEPEDAEHVRVHGRMRVIEKGGITDSPAAWRITVRAGRVVDIATLDAVTTRFRRVA